MSSIEPVDEYLWLEDIDGPRAVAWVEDQNVQTLAALSGTQFETTRAELLQILQSGDRIPNIVQRGAFVYNFWTDALNPRGLWRRTVLSSYRTALPDWEILLDLDALGAADGQSWVWRGSQTLPPAHDRCLISLSPGGGDAIVTREFDLSTKEFVPDGFTLPLGKNSVAWENADSLLVAPAYDEAVTKSGYPRTVRRWRRHTALAQAELVFEVEETDMAAGMSVSHDPAQSFTVFTRVIAFWNQINFYEDAGGRQLLDVPPDAEIDIRHGRLLIRLRSLWTEFEPGSLLCIAIDDFLAGSRDFDVLFTPEPRTALDGWVNLQSGVMLHIIDNVVSRLRFMRFMDTASGWQAQEITGLPPAATLSPQMLAPHDPSSETLLVSASGFLTPPSLYLGTPAGIAELLKSLPAQFDASGMRVEQFLAQAEDGTKIPYFVIGPDDPSPRPVLLYGYGGFEISLTPWYAAVPGAAWCAKGGKFAVANIRGGGEFGPDWHKAGIREGKRIAQDDFAAVAADIESRGIAPAGGVTGSGGSNGGLLIGNMLTRHPGNFGGLICTVPLLDMRRYTKLLAGASWVAEYGDPDKPEDWAFLQHISAYQLVQPGAAYPPILIMTTRRDDRVHPGHARKMAARLQEMGHKALYFELAEGGHGAGADAPQQAGFMALEYAFAWRELAGK